MRIRVKLFAIVRDAAGVGEAVLDVAPGSSVRSLAEPLIDRFPRIAPYLPRVAFAVNRSYAPGETELHDGDEVALIPPVSGG